MKAFASADKLFSGNVGNAVLDAILYIACTCVEHSHHGGLAEAISMTVHPTDHTSHPNVTSDFRITSGAIQYALPLMAFFA